MTVFLPDISSEESTEQAGERKSIEEHRDVSCTCI
jgi:hypothetical protein